jgi:hypothetical protein
MSLTLSVIPFFAASATACASARAALRVSAIARFPWHAYPMIRSLSFIVSAIAKSTWTLASAAAW